MKTIEQRKGAQDTTQLDAGASVDNDSTGATETMTLEDGTDVTLTRDEDAQCYIIALRPKGKKKGFTKRFAFAFVKDLADVASKIMRKRIKDEEGEQ